MKFMIPPRQIARTLLLVVLGLTGANLIGQYARYRLGEQQADQMHLLGLIQQFDLGQGHNIPDWYQSSMLLLCALLLGAIALFKQRADDSFVIRWWLLALLFFGLSVDQAAQAHAVPAPLLQTALAASGLNNFTWEIPVAVGALLLALAYLRFLAALPRQTRLLFIAAGVMYLGGALGLAMAGEWDLTQNGQPDLTLALLSTVEEFLEMCGVVIFIYALTSYLSLHVKDVRLTLGQAAPHPTPARELQPVGLVRQAQPSA